MLILMILGNVLPITPAWFIILVAAQRPKASTAFAPATSRMEQPGSFSPLQPAFRG